MTSCEGQATRVAEIYTAACERSAHVIVAGDLNDSADSAPIRLLTAAGLRDSMSHDAYDGPPGTYKSGRSANQKLDYLMLSPGLWQHVRAVGVERRGIWAPRSIEPFPSVTSHTTQASDHGALYADLSI
ncbi:endonuclease/exonuclease/phosphatase family protein [Actinoplanes sp. NPDC049118]|uniref:endonuclease/exonuclease/phosphatase family protein n=1 Tax=Actinoplanes sp. NPDC049118 TaxID=3155769 RepID=UPI0033EFC8B8